VNSFCFHIKGNWKCSADSGVYYILDGVKYSYPNWPAYTSFGTGTADISVFANCAALDTFEKGADMPDAGEPQVVARCMWMAECYGEVACWCGFKGGVHCPQP
jgi:hypothetical protein